MFCRYCLLYLEPGIFLVVFKDCSLFLESHQKIPCVWRRDWTFIFRFFIISSFFKFCYLYGRFNLSRLLIFDRLWLTYNWFWLIYYRFWLICYPQDLGRKNVERVFKPLSKESLCKSREHRQQTHSWRQLIYQFAGSHAATNFAFMSIINKKSFNRYVVWLIKRLWFSGSIFKNPYDCSQSLPDAQTQFLAVFPIFQQHQKIYIFHFHLCITIVKDR